eukprot:CAMPEP_0119309828 /NCGR_PEP_ID=MMETSP1333-20130426/16968_1 /TAXON_ID=418940 /ORGANISM="Scyphosphaera apsteinii, Strain RCC1455" /LENGTH=483 /DNA_ID=CAMNT_0007313877 /DNA_START=166 /DNA_END=1617 /DNA_ORIENTATION=+
MQLNQLQQTLMQEHDYGRHFWLPNSSGTAICYGLQSALALRCAATLRREELKEANILCPQPPTSSSSNAVRDVEQQQVQQVQQMQQQQQTMADMSTCTSLDEHVVRAADLWMPPARHPASYAAVSVLRPGATQFVPGQMVHGQQQQQQQMWQQLHRPAFHRRTRRQRSAARCACNTPRKAPENRANARRTARRARQREAACMAAVRLQAAMRRRLACRRAAAMQLGQQRIADAEVCRLALMAEHRCVKQQLHSAGRCPAYPAVGSLEPWVEQVGKWVAVAGLEMAITHDARASCVRLLPFKVQRACVLLADELERALGPFAAGVRAAVERAFGNGESAHGGRMLQVIMQGVQTQGERLNAAERAERAATVHAQAVQEVVRQQNTHEIAAADAAEFVLAPGREGRLKKAWRQKLIHVGIQRKLVFVNAITCELKGVAGKVLEPALLAAVRDEVDKEGLAEFLRLPSPPPIRGRGRGRGRVMGGR